MTNITNPAGWVNLVRPTEHAGRHVLLLRVGVHRHAAAGDDRIYTLWVQHSQTGFGSVTLQLSSVTP